MQNAAPLERPLFRIHQFTVSSPTHVNHTAANHIDVVHTLYDLLIDQALMWH